ncbi:MAG: glycoside hydrolase family 73 protein [Terracidiphilus sp.]
MIFLRDTVPAAMASQRSSGIPASVALAQAILESGWGQSDLATKANNYFGIKATANATPDEYAEFPTSEFVDGRRVAILAKFARYSSPADSFAAHTRLISQASRYAPAMAVKANPSAFATELQMCGYSTNPNYASSLMQIVNEFDLTQYDANAPQVQVAQTIQEG